jgi:hypothetical protein
VPGAKRTVPEEDEGGGGAEEGDGVRLAGTNGDVSMSEDEDDGRPQRAQNCASDASEALQCGQDGIGRSASLSVDQSVSGIEFGSAAAD